MSPSTPEPHVAGGPPGAREARVTAALLDLADTLIADFDPADFLYRVSEHCMRLLDIGDAGVMLAADGGPLSLVAASSEQVRVVELFELDAQEGPCFTAFHEGTPVDHTDLRSAPGPWPRFSARAQQAGYVSVHATPIRLRQRTIGVLNLFRRDPGRLPEADRHLARALADVTAISLFQQTTIEQHRGLGEQLQRALDTRSLIEQAKGFVVAQRHIDSDTAFQWLRAHAHVHHLRIADLAKDVVSGAVTLAPPRTGAGGTGEEVLV